MSLDRIWRAGLPGILILGNPANSAPMREWIYVGIIL